MSRRREEPHGAFKFQAVRILSGGSLMFMGVINPDDAFMKNFINPTRSGGLTAEMLASLDEPLQRRTNRVHWQGIASYIIRRATQGRRWTFNAVVLYIKEEP